MSEPDHIKRLQQKIWQGSIPLHITLSPDDCRSYDDSHPYLFQAPRLSYLPSLLTRLHAFFSAFLIDPQTPSHQGWFSFESVPLKWQHPIGLLYDIFSGAEPSNSFDDTDAKDTIASNKDFVPWKIVVHFSDWPTDRLIPLDAEGKVHHDAFVNSVKEADYLRNGTAKVMMSLSKDDSTKLWRSVEKHDIQMFNSINQKLLNPPGGIELRHVPIKLYLPTTTETEAGEPAPGTVKVVQQLVSPMASPPSKEQQTLGSALRDILPSLFPSRRSYIHAQAVLHGAVLPLNAPLQDLMRGAAYADGFLHVAVAMVS